MSDPESSAHEPCRPPVVNPYVAPVVPGLDEDLVVLAQAVEEPPPLWPTFVTTLVAIGGALLVSGVAMGIAAALGGGAEVFRGTEPFNDWLKDFASTEAGLAVLVVPGQLTFCLVVLLAVGFSPENPLDRLGLRRGNFPFWTWPVFLLGTPVVGMLMAQLLTRVTREPSEQLKLLEDLFASHAASSLALLLLLISVLPGLVEELLFRGFMQRRLLTRLPVVTAIGITTAFFAAAHMDPMHALGVVPLGIWLGVVAWRADSVWPAVFGHIGNNGFAIVMSAMTGPDPVREQVSPAAAGLVGLTLLAFAGCLILLVVRREPRSLWDDKSA